MIGRPVALDAGQICARAVRVDDHDLLWVLVSKGTVNRIERRDRSGQVVRTDVESINRYGSAARGVIVMRLNKGDTVAGIAVFREGLAQEPEVEQNASDEGEGDQAAAS